MDLLDTQRIISISLKEKSYKEKNISERKLIIDEAYKSYLLYRLQLHNTSNYNNIKDINEDLPLLELMDNFDKSLDNNEQDIIQQMIFCVLSDAEFVRGWATGYWEELKSDCNNKPTDIYEENKYLYEMAMCKNNDLIKVFRLIHDRYFNEILTEENIQKLSLNKKSN